MTTPPADMRLTDADRFELAEALYGKGSGDYNHYGPVFEAAARIAARHKRTGVVAAKKPGLRPSEVACFQAVDDLYPMSDLVNIATRGAERCVTERDAQRDAEINATLSDPQTCDAVIAAFAAGQDRKRANHDSVLSEREKADIAISVVRGLLLATHLPTPADRENADA